MPLKVYKRGKTYHYAGTVQGQRLRGTCRTADRNAAERYAAAVADAAWKRGSAPRATELTFAEAAHLYLDAQKPTRFLDKVAAYWKDTPVREITPGRVKQAAVVLYPNASGATRNRQAIVPTLAVINHAAEMELCSPLRIMRRFPVETKEKEPATWEWVEAFMSAARPNVAALACFMFLTGARISEAVALRWEDVDLRAAKAVIRQTKVGAERRAHLPPVLVAAMANIQTAPNPYRSRPENGRVFGFTSRSTAKPMWDRAIARGGLRPLSFHACRHGFATAMLHAGIDPVTVAKRGGWKNVHHLFETYGHANEDETITDRIATKPDTKTGNALRLKR